MAVGKHRQQRQAQSLTRPSIPGSGQSSRGMERGGGWRLAQPLKIGTFYEIDPTTHYAKSHQATKRVPIRYLRSFANTLPAQVAITRIADGILNLAWDINPPDKQKGVDSAIDFANSIERCIKRPNFEDNGLYRLFMSAIVEDLATLNVSAVERQPGASSDRPLWLWNVDIEKLHKNKLWDPTNPDAAPRYFLGTGGIDAWKPVMDENIFVIRRYGSSWRDTPPGPLEVAFKLVASWLGLSEYQARSTNNATQENLIDLGPVSEGELIAFRNYFRASVQGSGETPITNSAGNGVKVVRIGASNDDGLYLKYAEYVLRLIGLAFKLSARDYNITEPDNRATANAAADATFQYSILPMAQCLVEHFNVNVVDFYAPGYVMKLADTEPRNQKEEADTAKTLYDSQLITKNEARLDVGKESLGDAGEVFADGSRPTDTPEQKQQQQMEQNTSEKEGKDLGSEKELTDTKGEKLNSDDKNAKGKGIKIPVEV